jgi:anaerobic selenocysteine-containing dehydrogenase
MAAVNFLNVLADNVNKPGGILLDYADDFDPLAGLRPKSKTPWTFAAREVPGIEDASALLVHHANPVYSNPALIDRIRALDLIVSFSSFLDETTELADLILPDHSYLESWDIVAPTVGGRIATLARPVIKPEYDTKQTADVFIVLAREMGNPVPFESAEEAVRRAAGGLFKTPGSIETESEEDSWNLLLERGVWIGKSPAGDKSANGQGTAQRNIFEKLELGNVDAVAAQDGFTLLLYEHAALGYGAHANLPSLQELPDPMTSVMWGSWVEMNPKTAESLGIHDGDLIEIKSADNAITVPALLYPGIRPDVVAMPYGQGHTSHNRYARGIGANPFVMSDGASPGSDAPAMAIPVTLSKAAGEGELVRFGTTLPERAEYKR